jgi:hypothetical protein
MPLPGKFAFVLAAASALSACGAVDVLNPSGNNQSGVIWADKPVTALQVKILSQYAGGFSATLDGAPIGGFAPAPAPNVTVSAPAPPCFKGGTAITGTNPTRFQHDFSAKGNSSAPGMSVSSDTSLFVPPSLTVQPQTGLNLGLNEVRTVTVAIVPGPAGGALPVMLRPNLPTVAVDAGAAGAAVPKTFPPTAAGTFTVKGVSPGSFVVMVEAQGVQCAGVSGYVS